MTKKTGIIILIISIVAICMSAAALINVGNAAKQADTEEPDIQYVIYLGTNDKDTNEPVYSKKESKEKAKEILLDHFGGYTIQEAEGGWIDDDKVYKEYTLVIYLSDTDLDSVHAAADEMIETFNQSSILIQSNETTTEFYAGE